MKKKKTKNQFSYLHTIAEAQNMAKHNFCFPAM